MLRVLIVHQTARRRSLFDHYIGIDYSGAQTPTSSLSGLRVYASTPADRATEVRPPPSPRKHWTRRGIAEWLVARLSEGVTTLVGIDHAFSFPLQYFDRHGLSRSWPTFLDDFHEHWPTDRDHVYVDFVRNGILGNGAARTGETRWRRITEQRARTAKSVFLFDVQGSVAKSTHSGLPWLRYIRNQLGDGVHIWPFDGWEIPDGRSVIAEVYPALWNRSFPRGDRTQDQHDAYAVAEWMRRTNMDGLLRQYFKPPAQPTDREVAEFEGWIFGVQ